jgi:CBS domain-containing protein
MEDIGAAKRLCIYIGESDRWQGRPLHLSILEALRQEGVAGATVTRGIAGFGAHARIRTAAIVALSIDLPLVVEVVDQEEQVEKALALVGPMVREGLITVETVRVVKYTHRHLQPLAGDTPARQVMTREVVTVRETTPVADVVDLLVGRLFKAVPVVDAEGRVVGIITDTDLLKKGGTLQRVSITERLGPATIASQLELIRRAGLLARDVMTAPVVTIGEDTSLAHAADVMSRRGLKRLPVVDREGRLVGILSRVDLLRSVDKPAPAQESGPPPGPGRTIGEVMDSAVPKVSLDAELVDIVDRIMEAGLKRVIVVDPQDRVVGIINDGDLVARVRPEARPGLLRVLRRLGGREELPTVVASELMTSDVFTARPDMPVEEAVQAMVDRQRKRIVVVDDAGRPIGIVSRRMLLHAVAGLTPGGGTPGG